MKVWVTFGFVVALAAQVQARKPDTAEAASHFNAGLELYSRGKYEEAVARFEKANAISPHSSALFNIARCQEALVKPKLALSYYRRALAITTDAGSREDLVRRISRLEAMPVRIFISSDPRGATVFVDGREKPQAKRTPLVVQLEPGEHVLTFELKGYHMARRRIVVEMDKEKPVEITLRRIPAPCPATARRDGPCPRIRKEPPKDIDMRRLRLHAAAMGIFALTLDRPVAAGPGFQLYLTYDRMMFGAHFSYFYLGDSALDRSIQLPTQGVHADTAELTWLQFQVEGGYVFPFRSSFLYTTLGLGISTDSVELIGSGTDPTTSKPVSDSLIKSRLGFAWSLGVGIEAMATDWLSFGACLRLGMFHGDRADNDDWQNDDDQHHVPWGSLWGSVSLHL